VPKTFQCRLITPEAKVLDAPASAAIVPLWDGQMGFLPSRAPIVAKLGLGEMRLDFPDTEKERGGSRSFVVDGGFTHMVNNTLTILATKAIPTETIIESEAQAELAEAEARRTDTETDAAKRAAIQHDRQRAQVKLRAARSFRAKGGGI
jgi:F-type H+-transporting ATPase subunit epsilon